MGVGRAAIFGSTCGAAIGHSIPAALYAAQPSTALIPPAGTETFSLVGAASLGYGVGYLSLPQGASFTASQPALALPTTGWKTVRRALWNLSQSVAFFLRHAGEPPEEASPYILDRGLERSSSYTQRVLGLRIDEWVLAKAREAHAAGRTELHVGVLGPGQGNAERELVEALVSQLAALGIHLSLHTLALEAHPMCFNNLAQMALHRGSGIAVHQHFGSFDDEEPFPFRDERGDLVKLDLLYAIMSTVYSNDADALTAKIHNALRRPITRGERGGEAFYLYRHGGVEPAYFIAQSAFHLLRQDIDITVIQPPDMLSGLAYMVRRNRSHIVHFERILGQSVAAHEAEPITAYRRTLDGPPVLGVTSTFDDFQSGAQAYLQASGSSPLRLSEVTHRRAFTALFPGIRAGQPIDMAVRAAYGGKATLDAIQRYGDDFETHLETPEQTQRALADQHTAQRKMPSGAVHGVKGLI